MSAAGFTWARLTLFVGVLHFIVTAWLGLARHWAYLTSLNDLGVFDQAVWGMLHGAPFLNTNNPFGVPINWLGFHFNPILVIFVPLYLIHPAAEWMILVQAAAVSLTAWPLYLLAKHLTHSERLAFLWAAVFFVNPFVLSAVAWDFHPVALAAPFMAMGVLAVERRQPKLFALTCGVLLLIQEHFGIAVAGFGMLWWLRNRSLAPAVAAALIGIAHTGLVLGVIMPALSPTESHVMMSGGLGQLSRYGWLGSSLGEIVRNFVDHPLAVFEKVFVTMKGWVYLGLLLLPFLATPLAAAEFLLPGVADLLANLLSANPMPRSLVAYHSISLIPFLVAAGIYGSARIAEKFGLSLEGIGNRILWASVVAGYLLSPLPLPLARNYWQPAAWPVKPEKAVSEIRDSISRDASVSVQGNLGPHFSQRPQVYVFPAKVNEVDVVVLRLASPTLKPVGKPDVIGSLGQHLLMHPAEYLSAVEGVLDDGMYAVAYWRQPWLVLSRATDPDPQAKQSVRLYLEQLRKEWRVEGRVGKDGSI